MVDNTNPVSQFHPYQRPTAVPQSERPPSTLQTVRSFARSNSSVVIAACAALVLGMTLVLFTASGRRNRS
jgi:hypothetical protein